MDQIIKKIIVTCALPYSNGPIHLGHMLEHIQADIWVRYNRMCSNEVWFICADDAHGTPVMLKAQQLGITPEQMIDKVNQEHKKDFSNFYISYDNYYSTHSNENLELSILIYNRLKKNGFIKSRTIYQLFDPKEKMFLPDRFVMGTCPKCHSPNQYGDNCEICGSIYKSIDLINPKSIISNTTPILRNSEHFFFDLPLFGNMLKSWICSGKLQKQIVNKTQEWFRSGLQQWDITRDAPYFGFKIPNTIDKYFYVWLDATIGYMSAFKNLCNKRKNLDFYSFWKRDSYSELYHFIGKDIIYFHSLFWPAILEGSNFRKPSNLFVHGYVTINGEKMSKSRGTFIKASNWIKYLDADSLRYYFATKLSSNVNDIDLNFDDFIQRINTDIVNKLVNLASRNVSFIVKYFKCRLADRLDNPFLYNRFTNTSKSIGEAWINLEYSRAIREIISLADIANRYIDEKTPWVIARQERSNTDLHAICTTGINLFRILMTWLKPVLPSLSNRVEAFLQTSLQWNSISTPLLNHKITPFKSLYSRIKIEKINMLIEMSKSDCYINK